MLFFKYFFNRVYSFYNKRWPDKDPEVYAFSATVGFVGLWWLGVYLNILNIPGYNLSNYFNEKILIIVVYMAGVAFFYRQFISKDQFLIFSEKEYFKNTIFSNKLLGDFLSWAFAVAPFILILISAVISKKI